MINYDTVGIGVDIEHINRFVSRSRTTDQAFLARIFTEQELDYCFSKSNPAPHLTARFSAKEAVVKACASIGKSGIDYRMIEMTRSAGGVPSIVFHDPAYTKIVAKISVSHCDDHAIASAFIIDAT